MVFSCRTAVPLPPRLRDRVAAQLTEHAASHSRGSGARQTPAAENHGAAPRAREDEQVFEVEASSRSKMGGGGGAEL